MKEEFYMPIWIKTLLGFALVMGGIVFTFLVFRFIPVRKETGFDGLNSLMFVFLALGIALLLYIVGLIFDKRHPYSIFTFCFGLFLGALLLIRFIHLGI
ncbi:MAG: hypothetical protein M3R25_00025 [Bacteroidota bacterium]|nr:hypothetical protein [Bacteroidota bacterium]